MSEITIDPTKLYNVEIDNNGNTLLFYSVPMKFTINGVPANNDKKTNYLNKAERFNNLFPSANISVGNETYMSNSMIDPELKKILNNT